MSSLTEIVNVSITSETKGVTRAGFGTPMIVGPNSTASGRVNFYSDLVSLAADLTNGTADPEYKAAAAIVSQNPRVIQFAIGFEDSGDANMTATLNAIALANNNWYSFMIVDRTEAVQLLAAAWAETVSKKFAVTDVTVASTLRVALEGLGYENTIYFYHPLVSAVDQYIDAAFIGAMSPKDPGTYTAKFKTLIGITADSLSTTDSNTIKNTGGNTYEELGGRSIVLNGKMVGGASWDLVLFVDWLTARMTESVYEGLVNSEKIPYTDEGIEIISNKIEVPLKTGQNRGAISPLTFDDNKVQDGGYTITVPRQQDIPLADKQSRVLRDVEFVAWYTGAIESVIINGVVTL